MPISLTVASKLHTIPGLFDRLNAHIGAPTVGMYCNSGEGSSFLAIPTKRNHQPAESSKQPSAAAASASNNSSQISSAESFLDFKASLSPLIWKASAPSQHLSQHQSDNACEAGQLNVGMLKSPLMPTEQQWYQLNQLRIHAGAPERSERGIEKLMNYFAQLCWLEDKFPFDTDAVSIHFCWFEAFFSRKQVTTSCVHYEKGAVMWNIGALYSQLGAIQNLWTSDGLKQAALFYQKAAGAFLYLRDTLYPRFRLHIDTSSDLSDTTLTAVTELMLAQAAECFYQKAECDNTSSPVTSQIAAQTADYYDIAYKSAKQGNSFGKYRFPKMWASHMHTKQLVYTAMAHLHCPNFLAPDAAVGERQARLLLAKELAEHGLKKCTVKELCSPELRVLAASTLDRINRIVDEVDKANYDDYHQTILRRENLRPLRRPPHALVSGIDIVHGQDCSSIADMESNGSLRDIFDGVIGLMCLGQGRRASFIHSPTRRQSHYSTTMQNQPEYEDLVSSGRVGNLAPYVLDEIKRFVWETKRVLDTSAADLGSCASALQHSHKLQNMPENAGGTVNLSTKSAELLLQRANRLLVKYDDCQSIDSRIPSTQLAKQLSAIASHITHYLNQAQRLFWDSGDVVEERLQRIAMTHGLDSGDAAEMASQLMHFRTVFHGMAADWSKDDASPSHDAVNSALPFNVREHRSKTIELAVTMEQEAFSELFSASSSSVTDLHWSVKKIKTVVPCLDADWLTRCTQVLKNFDALRSGLISQSELFGADKVLIVQELREKCQTVAGRALQHQRNIDFVLSRVQEASRAWFGEDINESVAAHWASASRGKIVDAFVELGKEAQAQGGSDGQSAQLDTLVCLGIDLARKKVSSIKTAAVSCCNDVKSEMITADGIPVVYQLQEICKELSAFSQASRESEKIVGVFEEQLKKWNDWRIQCESEVDALSEIRNWLAGKLDPFVNRPSAPPSNQVSQNDGHDLKNLIQRQEMLERQQIKTATAIADVVDNDIKTFDASKTSPNLQRRQMMRKLSIAAANVERQSRDIDMKIREAAGVFDVDQLQPQRAELAKQMHQLQSLQREFMANQKCQLIQMHGRQAAGDISSSRRSSELLDQVKQKFSSLLSRRNTKKAPGKVEPSAPMLHLDELLRENEILRRCLSHIHVDQGPVATEASANQYEFDTKDAFVEATLPSRRPSTSVSRKPVNPAALIDKAYGDQPKVSRNPSMSRQAPEDQVPPHYAAQQPRKIFIPGQRQEEARRRSSSAKERPQKAEEHQPFAVPRKNCVSRKASLDSSYGTQPPLQHPANAVSKTTITIATESPNNIQVVGRRRSGGMVASKESKSTQPSRRTSTFPVWTNETAAQSEEKTYLEHLDRTDMRAGMDCVSKYMAWNRSTDDDYRQCVDGDTVYYTRRASLGGAPYIP